MNLPPVSAEQPTPRVDAYLASAVDNYGAGTEDYEWKRDGIKLMRQLERELADLRHDIARHVRIASEQATELFTCEARAYEAAALVAETYPCSLGYENRDIAKAIRALAAAQRKEK